MIKLLVKKFISNSEDVKNPKVRENYGILAGILGIICNAILFTLKLIIGYLTTSGAIISDAFNNLSDMGSSLVSTASAKISSKRPDKGHPFGHGRFEYIATLVVAFLIIFMGLEIIISATMSLIAIIQGKKEVVYNINYVLLGILSVSLLIKLWMFCYNRYLGKKINSNVLKASALDSVFDVFVTGIIIISIIIGSLFLPHFPLDNILSILVGIIIFISGLKMTISTVGDILGKPASNDTIEAIDKILNSGTGIYGVHDLIVHDYGPNRKMASAHVEVSNNANINDVHEIIEELENQVLKELNIAVVLHIDPIDISSPLINEIRNAINKKLKELNPKCSFHDLHLSNHHGKKVIFDLLLPFENVDDESKYKDSLISEIAQINDEYEIIINIDHY